MSSHKKSKSSVDKLEPDVLIDTSDNNNSTDNINTNGDGNTNPIDVNQISSLLDNMDLNQISGLLNNIDLTQLSSLFGGLMGGMGGTNTNGQDNGFKFTNDKRVDILNAVKPLVTPQRANLIDVILQVYTIRKILKR